MFVKILKIAREVADGATLVEFFYTLRRFIDPVRDIRQPNDSGNLIGSWIGKKPESNQWYDVELDVEDELIWEHNVHTLKDGESKITAENLDNIILQGQLEISSDGFCTIKIGESLHTLEITGAPAAFQGFVQIHARRIRLYDTGIIM